MQGSGMAFPMKDRDKSPHTILPGPNMTGQPAPRWMDCATVKKSAWLLSCMVKNLCIYILKNPYKFLFFSTKQDFQQPLNNNPFFGFLIYSFGATKSVFSFSTLTCPANIFLLFRTNFLSVIMTALRLSFFAFE
jgi:hypothetical protein